MVRFGADRLQKIMGKDVDTPLESRMVSRSVESAQKRVEGNNYDSRKQVLQYDDVLRKQREIMYAERNEVLENDVVTDIIQEMIGEAVDKTMAFITENLEAHSEKEETEEIIKSLNEKFLGQKPITESEYSDVMSDDEIRELVLHRINLELAEKRELLGDETMKIDGLITSTKWINLEKGFSFVLMDKLIHFVNTKQRVTKCSRT